MQNNFFRNMRNRFSGFLAGTFFDETNAKKKAKFEKDKAIDSNVNQFLDDKDKQSYYETTQKLYDADKSYTRIELVQNAWDDFNKNPLIRGALQQQGFNITLKNDNGNMFDMSLKIDGKELGDEFLRFFKGTWLYGYMDCEATNACVEGTRFEQFVQDKRTKELVDIVHLQGIGDGKVIDPFYPFPDSRIYEKRHSLYWVQSDLYNGEIVQVLSDRMVGRITPYSKGGLVGDTMLEPLHLGSLNQRKAIEDMLNMRSRMKPMLGVKVEIGNMTQSSAEALVRNIEKDLQENPNKRAIISTGESKTLTPNVRNMTDMEHNRWIDQHSLSGLHVPEGNIAGFAKNVNKSVLDQQSKNQYDGIISSIRDRMDKELIFKAANAWLLYNMDYPPSMIRDAEMETKWTDKVLQYMEYDLQVRELDIEEKKMQIEKQQGEQQ